MGGAAGVAGLILAGTAAADTLLGGAGNDTAGGNGGSDTILLGDGDDTAAGGEGGDTVSGGRGSDLLLGDGGDDILLAGTGDDMVFGGAGDDRIMGEDGNDTISGGAGADIIEAGTGDDRIIAERGDGSDLVVDGGAGSDTYDLSAITDAITIDLGQGGFGLASSSQLGTDTLRGIENVMAGAANDTIVANSSVNVMAGGLGNDTFVFFTIGAADGDTISDFQAGDKIDLSGIDANMLSGGNQDFVLMDQPVFTAAGQVIFRHEQRADGEYTVLEGNVDGDNAADFSIELAGRHTLKTSDFI